MSPSQKIESCHNANFAVTDDKVGIMTTSLRHVWSDQTERDYASWLCMRPLFAISFAACTWGNRAWSVLLGWTGLFLLIWHDVHGRITTQIFVQDKTANMILMDVKTRVYLHVKVKSSVSTRHLHKRVYLHVKVKSSVSTRHLHKRIDYPTWWPNPTYWIQQYSQRELIFFRYRSEIPSTAELSREMAVLESHVTSLGCTVAFCHNDILQKNIVHNKDKGLCYMIPDVTVTSRECCSVTNHWQIRTFCSTVCFGHQ